MIVFNLLQGIDYYLKKTPAGQKEKPQKIYVYLLALGDEKYNALKTAISKDGKIFEYFKKNDLGGMSDFSMIQQADLNQFKVGDNIKIFTFRLPSEAFNYLYSMADCGICEGYGSMNTLIQLGNPFFILRSTVNIDDQTLYPTLGGTGLVSVLQEMNVVAHGAIQAGLPIWGKTKNADNRPDKKIAGMLAKVFQENGKCQEEFEKYQRFYNRPENDKFLNGMYWLSQQE